MLNRSLIYLWIRKKQKTKKSFSLFPFLSGFLNYLVNYKKNQKTTCTAHRLPEITAEAASLPPAESRGTGDKLLCKTPVRYFNKTNQLAIPIFNVSPGSKTLILLRDQRHCRRRNNTINVNKYYSNGTRWYCTDLNDPPAVVSLINSRML